MNKLSCWYCIEKHRQEFDGYSNVSRLRFVGFEPRNVNFLNNHACELITSLPWFFVSWMSRASSLISLSRKEFDARKSLGNWNALLPVTLNQCMSSLFYRGSTKEASWRFLKFNSYYKTLTILWAFWAKFRASRALNPLKIIFSNFFYALNFCTRVW